MLIGDAAARGGLLRQRGPARPRRLPVYLPLAPSDRIERRIGRRRNYSEAMDVPYAAAGAR